MKRIENPVILIEVDKKMFKDWEKIMDRRTFHAHYLIGRKNMWYDMSGSRAVIAYEKNNTLGKLKKIVERHESDCVKFQGKGANYGKGIKLSIISDPGLGIVLPGDFD